MEIPSLDKSKLREKDLVQLLEPQFPNLPVQFWNENRVNEYMRINETCAPFPQIYDLEFNKYWQVMESSNGSYHLYGAYLDNRELNSLGPTVRILAMINREDPWNRTSFCQIWFDDGSQEPIITQVVNIYLVWFVGEGNYGPETFKVTIFHLKLKLTMSSSRIFCLVFYQRPTSTKYLLLSRWWSIPVIGHQTT